MVLLSPKLNLRVSQKQILTPGLVQMVSVLALNKLELKDMINAEMVENPVLEELDGTVPLLDEVAGKEEERERLVAAETDPNAIPAEKKDPFDEIDFGSFFQEYLDPGYRSPEGESVEKPSFENFLSRPSTLTDHLIWQLGAMNVSPGVRAAAELVIGNLSDDGYLIASEEELMSVAVPGSRGAAIEDAAPVAVAETPVSSNGAGSPDAASGLALDDADLDAELSATTELSEIPGLAAPVPAIDPISAATAAAMSEPVHATTAVQEPPAGPAPAESAELDQQPEPGSAQPEFTLNDLREAIGLVRQMDPAGIAARDLRECLLAQLQFLQHTHEANGTAANGTAQALADASVMVSEHLRALQNKQYKEIAKAMGRPLEAVMAGLDLIRTLDPRPGLRYNKVEPRLIEPDVAFIKQGDEYMVVLNDDDVPQLR